MPPPGPHHDSGPARHSAEEPDVTHPVDPRALAELLAEDFAREGIARDYAVFVAQHVHRPDADWRWCCGSNCDPCVKALGRLVDAARRRLAPGSPPSEPR